MDKNSSHLLRQWTIAVFFGGLTRFGVISAIIRGEYLIPCVCAMVAVLVVGQVWYARRKALTLFRSATPDQAVANYRRNTSKLPDGRAISAYMSALALAFYGEFDKSRDELSEVAWSSLPPMYEGLRIHVLTVIAILQERDYRKAFELASEARDLCSTSTAFPGSKESRRATEALVDASEVLAGNGTDATLKRLEDSVRMLQPLAKLIPALALARHYAKQGNEERAASYRAIITKIAPHCRPFKERVLV